MGKNYLLLLFAFLFNFSGFAQQNQRPNYTLGEVIVKFKTPVNSSVKINNLPFTDKAFINNLRSQIGLTDIRKVFIGETENDKKTFVLKFRSDIDVTSLCAALSSNPDVEYVTPNHLYYQQSNDPLYSQQWGLVNAKFDQAWKKYNSGKSSVLVAILDSGIDLDNISGQYGHPDLQSGVWVNDDPIDGVDNDGNGYRDDVNGFDFVNSEDVNGDGDYADPQDDISQPNDDNGHGTAVAGIIGGITNNSIGIFLVTKVPLVTH